MLFETLSCRELIAGDEYVVKDAFEKIDPRIFTPCVRH